MAVRLPIIVAVLMLLGSTAVRPVLSQGSADPFGFLQPTIQFSQQDRRQLDERSVLIRILPAKGHELAALAAGSLNVGPEALLESVRNIVDLKKGRLVPEIGRFSSPPLREDLQPLTLDDVDLNEIKRCRPARCGLKLTPGEIGELQQAIATNGGAKDALERAFRDVVLGRVRNYLRHGEQAASRQFSTLVQNSPYIQAQVPELGLYLENYPASPLTGSESFLYWSKETYAWKPMITATHVTILRGGSESGAPEVIVVSRDIFSTRYTSGSLNLTLLLRDAAPPQQRYLVYINRTSVDGVRALWRPFVEYRIKRQARKIFADVRERIERRGQAVPLAQ